MIDDLKPYPEYKDSGVPWLGKVPQYWDLRRAKLLLREVDARSSTGKEQLLRVSQYTGVTQRKAIDGSDDPDTRAKSLVGYKRVAVNDLVINIMLAWNGSLGASRHEGIVSPAYCVYRLKPDVLPWYLHELLRLPVYKGRIKTASRGVVESRLRLYTDDLGRIEAIIPPPDEQAAIVRFLDHANRKIERAIRAKRKLITLLNEQKQAIIHRAVTRGLDTTVKLKPSGIPWLGEIPEHWGVRRNSYLFDERNERGRVGLPILVVSLRTGVTEGSKIDDDGREKRLIADVTKYKFAHKGDIAYNMMRMWQGAVGVVPISGMVSPAYVVAKPRPGVYSAYFDNLFHTDECKNEINRHSRGIVTDRNRLYWDQFKRLYFPVPPYNEQIELTSWIESETSSLNIAIARTEREIELLREYRTTLTAEVVTGKLDVREAAKHLPTKAEEPLPADDLPEDEDAVLEDEAA